jgi:hypothetical protein
MSSERDQHTLGSFESGPSPHEERLDGVGAEYVGDDAAMTPRRSHGAENTCLNCERPIDSYVARTVGDNSGCVEACAKCRHEVLSDRLLTRERFESTMRLVLHLIEEGEVDRGGR